MNTLHAASPEDPKVLEFAESPGRRLRVHRQAKGLEVERIATQMHLRPAVVEALEQDRYDELPGPVFVIGYLRNYARLVGLDPQPLIEAYRATNPGMEAPAPRVSTAPAPRPEIGSSHVLVRLVSLALIAGVIALLVLWWQNRAEQMAPLALDGEEGALSMPGDMPEGLPGADPIEEVPEISGVDEEAPADAGPTGLTGLTEPPPADLGPTPAGGLTLPPLPEQPDAGAADSEDATAAAQPLDETTDTASRRGLGRGPDDRRRPGRARGTRGGNAESHRGRHGVQRSQLDPGEGRLRGGRAHRLHGGGRSSGGRGQPALRLHHRQREQHPALGGWRTLRSRRARPGQCRPLHPESRRNRMIPGPSTPAPARASVLPARARRP